MWDIDRQLLQATSANTADGFSVQYGGGPNGIHIEASGMGGVRLIGAKGSPLPEVDEIYSQDELFCANYPQQESLFALRMACEPVNDLPEVEQGLTIELRISLQTRFLDTRPEVELRLAGKRMENFESPTASTSNIRVYQSEQGCVAVGLSVHDEVHTEAYETPEGPVLRLFGGFLEKGVIRRARPWLSFAPEFSADSIAALASALEASPVPLD